MPLQHVPLSWVLRLHWSMANDDGAHLRCARHRVALWTTAAGAAPPAFTAPSTWRLCQRAVLRRLRRDSAPLLESWSLGPSGPPAYAVLRVHLGDGRLGDRLDRAVVAQLLSLLLWQIEADVHNFYEKTYRSLSKYT